MLAEITGRNFKTLHIVGGGSQNVLLNRLPLMVRALVLASLPIGAGTMPPGVAITVSSGDSGFGTEFPAASQYVTAVGGTTLTRNASSRGFTESVWSGAGSGCPDERIETDGDTSSVSGGW